MKTRTQVLLIMAIAVITVIGACNKSVNSSKGSLSSADRTQVMTATNNLDQFSRTDDAEYDMTYEKGEYAGAGLTASCFTVTYVPSKNVYPHTKTIDYTGCPTRSGTVVLTFLQARGSADGVIVTAVKDYWNNGVHIVGTSTDSASGGILYRTFNTTFTTADNDVKTWHGTFVITSIQFNGEDAIQITGFGNGKETVNGLDVQHFKASFDDNNPAIRPLSCGFRVQGGVTIKLVAAHTDGVKHVVTEDYGDGTCDNAVTLTLDGGAPFAATLPLYIWPTQ